MSFGLVVIILIVCIALEGFFSGSEMAIVNADRLKLRGSAHKRSQWQRTTIALIDQPATFFSTTLFGTNICTVTATVVLTLYIIDTWGPHDAAFALLLFPFTLIFGELVPKSLFHYYANRVVFVVAPLLYAISKIFFPVIWVLSKCTDLLLVRLKRQFGKEPLFSREELELMIEAGTEERSDVKSMERTLISRIFGLAEKTVQNIKTPLVDVIALPKLATREEAIRVMEETGHTKIPVYSGRIVNVVGVLMNTDLLLGDPSKTVPELMRTPYYVPEEMPLDQLFVSMKRKGEALAVTVDEYGGATGIVTNEDLFEEVVGEIRDEHDEILELYQRLGPKRFVVSGRLEVGAANERLKLGIPLGDYETIAGFLVHLLERIPKTGDVVAFQNLQCTIQRATDRAVLEVEVVVK